MVCTRITDWISNTDKQQAQTICWSAHNEQTQPKTEARFELGMPENPERWINKLFV